MPHDITLHFHDAAAYRKAVAAYAVKYGYKEKLPDGRPNPESPEQHFERQLMAEVLNVVIRVESWVAAQKAADKIRQDMGG